MNRITARKPRGPGFLLLARYVPNVAKRSIWDQCKKKYILRTDRPTTDERPTDFSFGQYWGNFKWPYLREGSSDPHHIWFYGGVFGVDGSNGAISSFAKSKMALGRHLGKFKWRYLRGGWSDSLHVGSRMGFSGSADRIALILVWPNSIGMWEKTMREE